MPLQITKQRKIKCTLISPTKKPFKHFTITLSLYRTCTYRKSCQRKITYFCHMSSCCTDCSGCCCALNCRIYPSHHSWGNVALRCRHVDFQTPCYRWARLSAWLLECQPQHRAVWMRRPAKLKEKSAAYK